MMFENGFPGFDEASADQVVPEAPVEPVVSDVPVESGVPVVSEAPAKAKRDRKARRGVSAKDVKLVLDARAMLDDDQTRRVVAMLAGGQDDGVLVNAVLRARDAGVPVKDVKLVLDARALLDDGRARGFVAALTGSDDLVRLVGAVLSGRCRAAARLIVEAAGASDDVERMGVLLHAQEKDVAVLRDASRGVVVFDGAGALDGLRDMSLLMGLARLLGGVDISGLEGLA